MTIAAEDKTGSNTLLWGGAFGIVALLCAGLLVRGSAGEGWGALPPAAALAAFLLAAWLRHLLPDRIAESSRRRAAAVGALIAFLAHPRTWLLAIPSRVLYGDPSISAAPADLKSGFAGGLILGFWSLLLTGWLTIPVGAGLGMLVARLETRLGSRTSKRRAADSVPAPPPTPPSVDTTRTPQIAATDVDAMREPSQDATEVMGERLAG